MALVVEDGTGKNDAQTYISEADADAYWAVHSNPSTWTGASSSEKETALRMAAQALDAKFGALWLGYRANETQALDWPRSGVVDADGYAKDSDEVPERVKDAQCELALKYLEGDTLVPDVTTPGRVKLQRDKVGDLETETEYQGGASQVKSYPLVTALVRRLIGQPRVYLAGG